MFALERRLVSARPLRGLRWYAAESAAGPSAADGSSSTSPSAESSSPSDGPSSSSSSSEARSETPVFERAESPASKSSTWGKDSWSDAPSGALPEGSTNLDDLWRSALSAPPSALKHAPRPARSLLESSTPTPRTYRGLRRSRRGEGQTPHEAGTFNATLNKILGNLVNKTWAVDGHGPFRAPDATRGKSLNHLTSIPDPWMRNAPRVEDDDAKLVSEIDAMREELSSLQTPGEAVAWAQQKVFTRRAEDAEEVILPGGVTPRTTWPRTYPRALGVLINTLWMRMNSPHLALAMFEHARNLSIESYLAGCQTSAYNEIIRVHWEAFRDLNACLAAVQEMDHHGVAWDRYTAGFVGGVVDAAGRELLDARGKNAVHRWGSDAHVTLSHLEAFVSRDRATEDRKYETRSTHKRRVRQGQLRM